MKTDSEQLKEESISTARDFPSSVGWTQASIAVNSVLQLSTPVFLKMEFESYEPLLVDFRYHAFAWAEPLEDFPVDAVHTGLETEPSHLGMPPLFALPGQNLDGLLWAMGTNAFDGAAASWLEPGGRYKLSRWPNLTQHGHTTRQMHMMAMLGNAYFSTSELAAGAGVDEPEAQRLINALSLMRILVRSTEVPPAVMAETQVVGRRGLFARLRARLER